MSEEASHTAEKQREPKGKGEKEKHAQLNEFQIISQKDKMIFLNEQHKEMNNRIERTRDLFKKTGGIKGIFHTKMSTIEDRNSKDLTEAEEI